MPPRDTVHSFGKPERMLLLFGIFLVSVYAANTVYSGIYLHASEQSFWAYQTSPPTLPCHVSGRRAVRLR